MGLDPQSWEAWCLDEAVLYATAVEEKRILEESRKEKGEMTGSTPAPQSDGVLSRLMNDPRYWEGGGPNAG
mgnify:CR=1 FL=1